MTEVSDASGKPVAPSTFRVGSKLGLQTDRIIESLEARVQALEERLGNSAERRTS
ncbi:MAG: hypothetical protein R3E58_06915 [Phycisphaerae bacterium]